MRTSYVLIQDADSDLLMLAESVGDIVYLHVFGQGLLFLNTYEIAIDLLERKGAIYSDKPARVMAGDL